MITDLVRNERLLWSATGAGAAALGAAAVRLAANTSWRKIRREDPPIDVHDPETPLWHAFAWAAVTGMLAGMAALAARRIAASGWRQSQGELPPT